MKIISKSIFTLIILGLSFFIVWLLTYVIVFPILFPESDSEKYATENIQTSKLFDLFVEISSDTGYHPEPSDFFIRFICAIGLITGAVISYKLIWKNKPTNSKNGHA